MSRISIDINKFKNRTDIEDIVISIEALLYPTAIYIIPDNIVILNKYANDILGLKEYQEFNTEKWKSINPHIGEFIRGIKNDFLTEQRILITLFNGKKEIINFNLSNIKKETSRTFIIQFRKATNKYSVSSLSSMYSIIEEIRKLMPYLNNTGKLILKDIIKNNSHEENMSSIVDDLMYYEREISVLAKVFPELSHHEVIICGLLINNIDNNEISLLTKRSINSIFVTIHRINKKLQVKDRKELLHKIKIKIKEEKRAQDNFKFIEDFDI